MSTDLLARRAVAVGAYGAVASGSGTAAAIGAAALLDGGNAFDAAVATALAETVALPSKCGLAGDLVALHLPAGASAPVSLISVGGAAQGLQAAAAALEWQVPATGPLSVGIPGAPAGYAHLAALGTLPLARLVQPAADLAGRGIWWSPMNVLLERESRALLQTYQPSGCVYSPARTAHPDGALVRLPGLASALEEFAALGPDLFTGSVGRAMLETVIAHGGVLTAEDLASVQVLEEPAHRVDTRSGPIWATNTPTYGTALTGALDGRHPDEVGPAEVSSSMAAIGSRRPAYACARDEGTSTVAAVDAAGNAVVIVHSLSFPQYGSGLVTGEYDLILSNRAGRGFVFEPDHPAGPAPGRRPPTTLHAWAIHRPDGWLLGATPGGRQQVPWNVEVLTSLFAHHHNPPAQAMGQALISPRRLLDADGAIRREGHEIAAFGARSSHTLVHLGPGRCTAGADPRWDGTAVAV